MATKPFFRGQLIAIGGNEDKANELVVLKRVIQEVGKAEFNVCVITTASREPEQQGKNYRQAFTTLGASRIEILNITCGCRGFIWFESSRRANSQWHYDVLSFSYPKPWPHEFV